LTEIDGIYRNAFSVLKSICSAGTVASSHFTKIAPGFLSRLKPSTGGQALVRIPLVRRGELGPPKSDIRS